MGGGASVLGQTVTSVAQSGQSRLPELPSSVAMVTSRIPEQYIPFSTILSPMLNPARYKLSQDDEDDEFERSFLATTANFDDDVDINDSDTHSPSDSGAGLFDDELDDHVFMLDEDEAEEDLKAAVPLQAICRAQIIRHTTKIGVESTIVNIGKELSAEKKKTLGKSGSSKAIHVNRTGDSVRAAVIAEMSAEAEAALEQTAQKGLAAMVTAQQEAYLKDQGI
ncbi:hypothetical protein J8273_5191 [Carpediemonas membranifera]|uniref:Uncharacterized protein n=1 Tax=Carpediemonas membranifera TaxID=201153 RepID=A0A8J6B1D9_9EUKA|nr:hypothetical protein J8273_5191 [Carpediemonas membranifera]|eukprot:KAG9392209.1 hypothetical protein J8273_5191 [Carpediemonas membranifera]